MFNSVWVDFDDTCVFFSDSDILDALLEVQVWEELYRLETAALWVQMFVVSAVCLWSYCRAECWHERRIQGLLDPTLQPFPAQTGASFQVKEAQRLISKEHCKTNSSRLNFTNVIYIDAKHHLQRCEEVWASFLISYCFTRLSHLNVSDHQTN